MSARLPAGSAGESPMAKRKKKPLILRRRKKAAPPSRVHVDRKKKASRLRCRRKDNGDTNENQKAGN